MSDQEIIEEPTNDPELTEEELEAQEEEEYDKAFFAEDSDSDDESEDVETEQQEEDVEEVEEPVEEVELIDDTVVAQPEMVTLLWNGKEVSVTKEEERSLAQQGFDYTYKTQQLSKHQKKFDAWEQGGVEDSEIELWSKARSGDKEALAQLNGIAGIDPLDLLDIEPKEDIEHGDNKPVEPFISPQVNDLMEEVSKNDALYQEMQVVEKHLPEAVVNMMAKDPKAFYDIVNEVKSGDARIVIPKVSAAMATLNDMDKKLVTGNPQEYAKFYLNVKQNLINANQQQARQVQSQPKKNMAEVGIPKPGRTRSQAVISDAFNSDKEYQKILDRLNEQG